MKFSLYSWKNKGHLFVTLCRAVAFLCCYCAITGCLHSEVFALLVTKPVS